MLKWTGMNQQNRRPLIGIGLEEKNLELLRDDRPIIIDGKEMGIAFDILLYYGKDMDALLQMTESGIGPETIVHDARKPTSSA